MPSGGLPVRSFHGQLPEFTAPERPRKNWRMCRVVGRSLRSLTLPSVRGSRGRVVTTGKIYCLFIFFSFCSTWDLFIERRGENGRSREGRSAAGRGRLRWCTLYRGSTCRGASAGSFGGSVAVATLAVLHSPAFAFSFIAASVILCYGCFRRRGVGYPLCPYARYGLSRMAAPPLQAKQDVRQFPVRAVLSPFSRVTTAAG